MAAERLGNLRAVEAVPALAAALRDKDSGVRSNAAGALLEIGEPAKEAMPALREALLDSDSTTVWNAAGALHNMGVVTTDLMPAYRRLLQDPECDMKVSAAVAIAEYAPPEELLPIALECRGGPAREYEVEKGVRSLMTSIAKDRAALPLIVEALKTDRSWEVREWAARALGDGAYGTGPNLRACAQMGVELLTKRGAASHEGLTKRDFEIAPDAKSVTCPAGHTSTKHTLVKNRDGAKNADGSHVRVPSFKFSKAVCKGCPLAAQCGKNVETEGREIVLNANEAELQAIKAFNATPESKPLLRRRCAIERLLSHLVRMGMRQARFFGLHMAQFQAFMTAAAYNLQRFITLSAARS